MFVEGAYQEYKLFKMELSMFSMLCTGYFYLIEDQCVVFSKSSFFFFVDFALWLIVSSSLFIGY